MFCFLQLRSKKVLFIIPVLLVVLAGCGANRRIYSNKDDGRVSHSVLTDSTYNTIRQYCLSFSSNKINDTLIIKYDFNHESCWSTLDESEESHIRKVIEN